VLGGLVSGTNISSGGVENIEAGYSFNTTVSSGAVEVLSGVYGASSASDTTVLSGGELIVSTLGISISAAVAGSEILQGDGEDYDSTIESGGLHVVQGRSYYAVLFRRRRGNRVQRRRGDGPDHQHRRHRRRVQRRVRGPDGTQGRLRPRCVGRNHE